MSNLQPKVDDMYTPERSQLAKVLDSVSSESVVIREAVRQAMSEYGGFIEGVAEAATDNEGFSYDPEVVQQGIETIAQYAVWKALIETQEQGGNDE